MRFRWNPGAEPVTAARPLPMTSNVRTRVLIIDDDAAVGRLLKLNLEDQGRYAVQVEHLGSHGVAAARRFKPDLILLDLVMPDRSGLAVAHELEGEPNLRDVPVIFISAMAVGNRLADLRDAPRFRPVIAKPIRTQELLQCIESSLAPRELARAGALRTGAVPGCESS